MASLSRSLVKPQVDPGRSIDDKLPLAVTRFAVVPAPPPLADNFRSFFLSFFSSWMLGLMPNRHVRVVFSVIAPHKKIASAKAGLTLTSKEFLRKLEEY